MKNVIIYSTPTCHLCREAKDYFKENNVVFTDKDITVDSKARDEMIQKSGGMSVPVIDIEGMIINGFDKSKIASTLEIN